MVTDDMHDMRDIAAPDQRLAVQRAQVAQYWQRCYESRADCKLSRSLSASDTHISDDEEEDDDEADEDRDNEDVVDIDIDDDEPEYVEAEYEYRYVHYRRRSSRLVSGLPLLCGNCGVSFFSLQSVDDQDDCYCSGECKWSVIMYREMDRRMCAMRANRARSNGAAQSTRAYDRQGRAPGNCQYAHAVDDGISCH